MVALFAIMEVCPAQQMGVPVNGQQSDTGNMVDELGKKSTITIPRTTISTKPSTAMPTTTTSTTPSPTTTSPVPTTSTTPLMTTTTEKRTSTEKSTEGTYTTSGRTTNTIVPAPTSAPTPAPPYWYVRDNNTQIVCILMSASIDVTIGNVSQTVSVANNGSTATGVCGDKEQRIEIMFGEADKAENLSFVFELGTENKHALSSIVYEYRDKSVTMNVTKFWANDKDLQSSKMYRCNASQILYDKDGNKVIVRDMSLEVFRNSTSLDFDTSMVTCPEDTKVSNLVPIIVGAALGGLILIVLIAYLIGRRRSRHGYEQV
jgi:lysosomal-associated membrane protein 1/2